MPTATQVARAAKQPRGGYIPPKMMAIEDFADDAYRDELVLNMDAEQSHPATIGVVVDYMTRFMLEARADPDSVGLQMECFSIPRLGIREDTLTAEQFYEVASRVKGLDRDSIDAMFMLTAWDTMFRSGIEMDPEKLHPDDVSIKHVVMMVEKALEMLGDGDIAVGPVFIGGFPRNIRAADADYIRDGWLVDMKVSRREIPDNKQTLQLMIYYIMGKKVAERGSYACIPNPFRDAFESMRGIEILNPRCGIRWRLPVSEIPDEVIIAIREDVMGGYEE